MKRVALVWALMFVTGLAWAQSPAPTKSTAGTGPAAKVKEPAKPSPGSLEETLEKVLQMSGEVRAAEAKVRAAEADLYKVRQDVMTRAASLYAESRVAMQLLRTAEQLLLRAEEVHRRGIAPDSEVMNARGQVEKARANLEKTEAELKALRGEFPIKFNTTRSVDVGELLSELLGTTGMPDRTTAPVVGGGPPLPSRAKTLSSAMEDRVRKFLDTEVTLKELNKVPLSQAMDALMDSSKQGLSYRITSDKETVTLPAGKMPIGAWLQLIEDGSLESSELRIVVREYGLLITPGPRAPRDAPRAVDLWQQRPGTKVDR